MFPPRRGWGTPEPSAPHGTHFWPHPEGRRGGTADVKEVHGLGRHQGP